MEIILILILLILIILIVMFFYIKTKIQNFSSRFFGTKDFIEGIKNLRVQSDETPKTPYGMDKLVLPEIEKDFPNINISEMKKVAENNILLCFKSVENKKLENINNISDKLKNQINLKIKNSENIKFNNINIHQTVINKYENIVGGCKLIFQSSIGYNIEKKDESKKYEKRINTEFIYIYDDKGVQNYEGFSLKCPNCGAPIKNLGEKFCLYCNALIIDLAPKTWKFNDIYLIE